MVLFSEVLESPCSFTPFLAYVRPVIWIFFSFWRHHGRDVIIFTKTDFRRKVSKSLKISNLEQEQTPTLDFPSLYLGQVCFIFSWNFWAYVKCVSTFDCLRTKSQKLISTFLWRQMSPMRLVCYWSWKYWSWTWPQKINTDSVSTWRLVILWLG